MLLGISSAPPPTREDAGYASLRVSCHIAIQNKNAKEMRSKDAKT